MIAIETLVRVLWVGLGGAIGSSLRYLLSGLVQQSVVVFPLGTMAVNVIGCFCMGFLSDRLLVGTVSPHVRLAVTVGLLGGFTTFSTFSLETLRLANDRLALLAALNVAVTVALCLLGVWAGQRVSVWMMSP